MERLLVRAQGLCRLNSQASYGSVTYPSPVGAPPLHRQYSSYLVSVAPHSLSLALITVIFQKAHSPGTVFFLPSLLALDTFSAFYKIDILPGYLIKDPIL